MMEAKCLFRCRWVSSRCSGLVVHQIFEMNDVGLCIGNGSVRCLGVRDTCSTRASVGQQDALGTITSAQCAQRATHWNKFIRGWSS